MYIAIGQTINVRGPFVGVLYTPSILGVGTLEQCTAKCDGFLKAYEVFGRKDRATRVWVLDVDTKQCEYSAELLEPQPEITADDIIEMMTLRPV